MPSQAQDFLGKSERLSKGFLSSGGETALSGFMFSLLSDRNGLDFNWEKLVQNLVYAPADDVPDGQLPLPDALGTEQAPHLR